MNLVELNKDKGLYEERFVDLMCYCFKMCKKEDFKADWKMSAPERETVLGMLDGDTLASCITIPYRKVYLDGQCIPMAGLGGVTTASTYRSGGVCSNLIKEGLKVMYDKGAVFSMLAPFSYEFYQKLGWKWCYNNISYEFEIERLKRFKNLGDITYLTEETKRELQSFYETYIQSLNGSCLREEYHWKKRISKQLDHYTILYRNNEGQVEGYMIYKINHQALVFEIVELQYTTMSCLRSFFNYIGTHSAQVTKVNIAAKEHDIILDILPNPRCQVLVNSYMMGRIINVVKALETYKFAQDGVFVIDVKDDICEWNTGHFKVTISEGLATVEKVEEEPDFTIDIRELMQVIIGFKTMQDVDHLETITWIKHKEEVLKYFKGNKGKVALYDYF